MVDKLYSTFEFDSIKLNIILLPKILQMYSDFYFPSYSQAFMPNFSFFPTFGSFQSFFNVEIPTTCLHQTETQSYTTKQMALEQKPQPIKKEEDSSPRPNVEQILSKREKKKQNKSIFHNYQKHLVTTLKQKITIDQVVKYDSEDSCLKDLWQGFNKAKIANRTLLLAVFGQQNPCNIQIVRYLEKCNLESILNKYSLNEVKQAQKKIRKIVKEYFQDKNLEMELIGRKLPNEEKPIFKHYVSYFLAQLAQGTLNRRLPKRYKTQMIL